MKTSATIALLLACPGLAGCWTAELPRYADEGLTTERVVRLHSVQISDGALADDERARLSLFLATLPPRYATQFTVNAGGPAGEADARAVVAALAHAQVPAPAVTYRPSPGPVLVTAETIEVLPQRCFGADQGVPRLDVPLGCANQYNLTRMVEQPWDLLAGRVPGPAFSAPVAQAAGSYLGLSGDGAARTPGTVPGVRTPGAGAEEEPPADVGSPGDATADAPAQQPSASPAAPFVSPSQGADQ